MESTPPLPQLWDLAQADGIDEIAEEAAALAIAEQAGIGMCDRLRGWAGDEVRLQLADGVRHGQVEAVFRDAVVLRETDADLLVPLGAVLAVQGPPPGTALPPVGRQRGSGLGVARDWVGGAVSAGLASGSGVVYRGELSTVGADHLELAVRGATVIVAWGGLRWVRHQS